MQIPLLMGVVYILSGCEYLPSLPKIKLLTAQKLIRENPDIDRAACCMKRGKRSSS